MFKCLNIVRLFVNIIQATEMFATEFRPYIWQYHSNHVTSFYFREPDSISKFKSRVNTKKVQYLLLQKLSFFSDAFNVDVQSN